MKISDIKPDTISFDFDPSHLKIISGGQNGADQAGLRAARLHEISTGGWAPKGWKTLDGPRKSLLQSFCLQECEKEGYPPRTELNVKESDVTLRFASNMHSAGERCTKNAILKHKKPYVDFDVTVDLTEQNAADLAEYIARQGYSTINIAGNSEKTSPGIGKKVEKFLNLCFNQLKEK
jgi:hypothetical protein